MRKIGINMHAIGGLTNEDYVRKIKELDFNSVFTGVTAKVDDQVAYAELFTKYGLEYETLHAPFGHINDIWLDCEGGEKMLSELINSVDHCKAAGVGVLVVHLSSGLKPPSITELGQSRFARLMEHAEKNGVTIAYENQRMLGNIAWAFEQFANSPSLGFCWDCGHENCFTNGRQYMPIFGNKLVCTHIHDNSGVFNADNHLIPFDGKFDFNRFAKQINEAGYKGSLMLEVIERNSDKYKGMPSDEYLERAANAVKKLRAMVDGE